MRIVHFTDVFLTHSNGVASSILNLVRELGKEGHEILIIAPRTKTGTAESVSLGKNVHLVSLRSYPAVVYPKMRISMPSLRTVLRELQTFAPDVAQIHTPMGVGFCGLRACKKLGIPVIGVNHIYLTRDNADFFRSFVPGAFAQGIVRSVTLSYFRMFYGKCDLVTSPSMGLVEAMRLLNIGRTVEHLPNALSLSRHAPLSADAKRTLKERYALRKYVLIHCGRLSKEKSVDVVVQAFAEIHQHRNDVSLLIIGDGPARKETEALVRKLGCGDAVAFTGMLKYDELMASGLLSLGDVFATASTMENQPMALLEAFSFGLPVVAVRAAALPELIAGNGVLVEPGDAVAMGKAILDLLKNDSKREMMAKRSYDIADTYAPESVATQALAFYKKVIAMH